MSEKLFKKVNKKRGLALEKAEKDMRMLICEGINYVNINLEIVKNILKRINLKASARDFNCNPPFNEDDFSLVEKAFKDINDDIFIELSCSLIFLMKDRTPGPNRSHELIFTKSILKCLNKVKKRDNKIDSIITKIKREEFSTDINYAIYVIKGVIPFTFKTIKKIASLFVQG